MNNEPKEPDCPPGRRPHKDRVAEINKLLGIGQTASICIDDTPEHRTWYLHELAKYPDLIIKDQGILATGIYAIKVLKLSKEK